MIKVGNTTFNEEVIKGMSLKQFKESHKHLEKTHNLEEVYYQINPKKSTKDA